MSSCSYRRQALLACIDLAPLFAATMTYAGLLTASIRTGRFGWQWPSVAYTYEHSDIVLHAMAAALLVMPVLLLARWPRLRRPAWSQHAAFAIAALLVLRLGPPDATVFGNTWTTWEVTRDLWLLQWQLVVPVVVATTALRAVLRARLVQ